MGVSAFVKNVGSLVMIRFAPAFIALLSAFNDASEVVAMPVTRVEGSPALKVSAVSGFHAADVLLDAIDNGLCGDPAGGRTRHLSQRRRGDASDSQFNKLTS